MPSILNYQANNNVSNPSDFVDKLRDFALANGWTLFEQYKNLAWTQSGTYGFNTASPGENYVELHTSDYGGNIFKFRIRCRNTASASSDNISIDFGVHKYIADADKWNTASSTHPFQQSKNETAIRYDTFSCKATDIPTVWFFGNSKVIYFAIKYDGVFCDTLGFGILEMVDTTEGLGWWVSDAEAPGWSTKNYTKGGLTIQYVRPGSTISDTGSSNGSGLIRKDWWFTKNTASLPITNSRFFSASKLLANNPHSSIKPALQNWFFYNDDGIGIWRPYAKNWHIHLNTYGLLIGEQIKYGSEKYITFPQLTQNVEYIGHAFRIE